MRDKGFGLVWLVVGEDCGRCEKVMGILKPSLLCLVCGMVVCDELCAEFHGDECVGKRPSYGSVAEVRIRRWRERDYRG